MSELFSGLTATLADSCARLQFESIPFAVVSTAKAAIADCLGCMLAGSRSSSVRPVLELALSECSAQTSSIVGWPHRVAPATAALVNGTSAHALDFDDMGIALLGHPSVVLVPAILALAEAERASGRDVIRSYVAGFEVAAILGRIVNPAHYTAGWHTTCTVGTVAAAVAASSVMRLNAQCTEAAIGIAASHAGGLRANFGSDVKPLHAGMAARAGLLSAQLARAGLSSSPGVLEAHNGFLHTLAGVAGKVPNGPGFPGPDGKYELVTSGLSFKLHACCGTAHAAIDSALRLVGRAGFDLADILEVNCDVNRMAPDILTYHEAKSVLHARFCLEYCIAVALIDRVCGMAQFEAGRIGAPDVQALMQRVSMRVDPAMSLDRGGLTAARVTLRWRDGREWSDFTDSALGSPGSPAPQSRLEAKFLDCAGTLLDDGAARETLRCIASLESAADITWLAASLRVAS